MLRTALLLSCRLLCYADDTLVIAQGENWQEAWDAANKACQAVMCSVRAMGLKVAPQTTKALFFYNRAMGRPPFI